MTETRIKIEVVSSHSPHLARVKELGRTHSKTLGMFPNGAFDEYAARQQILGAINARGECVGYVLHRVAKERAMIVHLCVHDKWQGRKIAKALFERLRQTTKAHGLRGIGLWCRRDYDVNRAWPRFGFAPLDDRPGRNLDGKELTFWWLDHQQPDLFRVTASTKASEARLSVAMDANVFFDLYDSADPESAESKSLLADWLQDSVELCVTKEIYTEINRNAQAGERDRQRSLVTRHRVIDPVHETVELVEGWLRPLFPKVMSEADESDFRQLAKTMAGGLQFFVTRDEILMKLADPIYCSFGVTVLRPTDLINRIDALRRESEYQPIRLGGSRFTIHLIKSEQEAALVEAFQAVRQGESAAAFKKSLRAQLSAPQRSSCYVAEDERKRPLTVFGYDRSDDEELKLPLLRVDAGNLGATIARHLLSRALQISAREGRTVTTVTEPALDSTVLAALEECGFSKTDRHWAKLNFGVASTGQVLAKKLEEFGTRHPQHAKLAVGFSQALDQGGSDLGDDAHEMGFAPMFANGREKGRSEITRQKVEKKAA